MDRSWRDIPGAYSENLGVLDVDVQLVLPAGEGSQWTLGGGHRAAHDDVGNSARFINHSCAPNCEAIEEEGRIFIETTRKIPAGGELTYDYNLVLEERHTPAVKRAHACFCGARHCRGTLLGSKR